MKSLSESLLLWYRSQTPLMGVRCTLKQFLTKVSCVMTGRCHAIHAFGNSDVQRDADKSHLLYELSGWWSGMDGRSSIR